MKPCDCGEAATPISPEDAVRKEALACSGCAGEESTLIKTVGWISAALGAVALGLLVGRELRQRYKFTRRTPYDFYAHSGDGQDADFGLGI
ncbi:MAG: hypothetical protein FWD64_02670 [Acidobacteriaceae bacterium]|nr:hypothetical protein [Acidobacteriaceae bacterium]